MRTAYLMIIFLVLCLFSACEKEEEAPFPVSQEQLVEIMADVHFAEAAVKDLLNLEKDSGGALGDFTKRVKKSD